MGNRVVFHYRDADQEHNDDAMDEAGHAKRPPDHRQLHWKEHAPVNVGKDDSGSEMNNVANRERIFRLACNERSHRRDDVDLPDAKPTWQKKQRAHGCRPHKSSNQGNQRGKHNRTLTALSLFGKAERGWVKARRSRFDLRKRRRR
jgi:hypothetical protein